MNRSVSLAAFCGWLLCLAGCQCCPTANCYYDAVDVVADCELELDCLYHPELDVSRIGQADWCRCPVNRLLCGCSCRDQCCYVPAWGPPIQSPCPEIPKAPVPPLVAPCPLPPLPEPCVILTD